MVSYADQVFYEQEYAGKAIPSNDLTGYLVRATMRVDGACNYRISPLTELPSFSRRQVQLATCAEAEAEYDNRVAADLLGNIGSYSIGDVSVSAPAEAKKTAEEVHYGISEKAISYLLPTGLLDRRV